MKHKSGIRKEAFFNWLCLIFFLSMLLSCKKDSAKPDYPAGTNENINTWILDSLKRYYYWSAMLPADPKISVTPKVFFESVRNPSDRFSYIILPSDPETGTPTNKSQYGFDYSTIKQQLTGQVIGIVKYVLNDSPASRSGLKRGDYISKINGRQLTEANALALQDELLSGDNAVLTLAVANSNSFKDTLSVELTAGFTFEQPSVSKIIGASGNKIGYIYINDFNTGLASSLYSIFADFKNAGVSGLILDLRYNSGGQVAEAAGLCTMIVKGISYNTPFIIYKGNKNGGTRTESIGDAATFDGTLNFNTLLQNNLGLSQVFILSTGATASAAEVMVNNLRPYMQVVLIGEKTRGKDEASFKISDTRNPPKVEWEMHPIIYKLFNAAGNGDYSAGINPDILVNELAYTPLLPFGDVEDPLTKTAINSISGITRASVSDLNKTKAGNLVIPQILADTRLQAAQRSMVITHR